MPKTVLIGIPTLSRYVPFQFLGFCAELAARGHGVLVVPGHQPRVYAKNTIVHGFRRSDHAKLLIVDADMVPTVEAFDQLVQGSQGAAVTVGYTLQREISDGRYRLTVCAYDGCDDQGKYTPVKRGLSEPTEVLACGGAFTLYTRNVLSDRRLWLDEEGSVFADRSSASGKTLMTEDMDFSERARQAGYKLAYVPSAKVGHLKELDLNMVEDTCLGAMEGRPL